MNNIFRGRDFALFAASGDKSVGDAKLLADFKKKFPNITTVLTKDALMKLVNINATIREWYLTYKNEINVQLEMPEFLDKDSVSVRAWEKVKDDRILHTAKEIGWQGEILSASNTLKSVVNKVEGERLSAYGSLSPLDIIDRVTVNQLPLDKAVILATFVGDKQAVENKQKELVLAYKKSLYSDFKANKFKNPFSE